MGFSLKRALLGAINAGATSLGEINDAQLKEEAASRLRAEAQAERRGDAVFQADLLDMRQKSRDATLEALETKKRKDSGAAYSAVSAAVTAAGFKPGTQAHSAEMSRRFSEQGHDAKAATAGVEGRDTRDYDLKLSNQAADEKYRNSALAVQRDQVRATREAGINAKAEASAAKKEEALAKRLTVAGTFGVRDRDGKQVPFTAGPALANQIYNNGIAAGFTPEISLDHTESRMANLNVNIVNGIPFESAMRTSLEPFTKPSKPVVPKPSAPPTLRDKVNQIPR